MGDDQFLSALDRIERELAAPSSATGADLCATYKRVRSALESVIPVIRLIPVWGERLAAILRFLMTLADTVCPA